MNNIKAKFLDSMPVLFGWVLCKLVWDITNFERIFDFVYVTIIWVILYLIKTPKNDTSCSNS